ncbi:MAG: cytochrome d ubiquinol oxidase subunit II [Gammaproteobacteria bacterium]|nr:cytochrome d ubiquinol oxidase subunit II [Gammaproteobacteria bacterium]
MNLPIDYVTLRVIWWVLLGLLLIGFAVMDGFDLGIGILLHRVARTNEERRVVLNTVGPVWEGNQIWLVLGGGAIFAAWPEIYAVSFSGFYFAILLVLLALILRPVGFKYRSKIDNTMWRSVWDFCLFVSGFVPALVFGIAVGNVLEGVPFHYDETLRSFYSGTFWGLLNPFAILCGLVSVAMLAMHGAAFLTIKTTDIIQQRARTYVRLFACITIVLFSVAGAWVAMRLAGYVSTDTLVLDAPSNPLHKTVVLQVGAWLLNYSRYPLTMAAPLCGYLGAIFTILLAGLRLPKLTWLMSAISIAGIITTVGISMFPFILPSSTDPNSSLLVWDASSSHLTLLIMLIATMIFLPLIIVYTSWVYYVLRGKVTSSYINQNQNSLY